MDPSSTSGILFIYWCCLRITVPLFSSMISDWLISFFNSFSNAYCVKRSVLSIMFGLHLNGLSLVCIKTIYGFRIVLLTRFQDRAGEVGLIWGVGEMLSFQAESGIFNISEVSRAQRSIQEITGIELYPGFHGKHLHHAP